MDFDSDVSEGDEVVGWFSLGEEGDLKPLLTSWLQMQDPVIIVDQAVLKKFLLRRLKGLDNSIGEMLLQEKQDDIHMKELEKDTIVVEDNLLRIKARLKEREKERAHHESRRDKAHDELCTAKNMHATMNDKLKKERAFVSQMETKVDRLLLQLFYTQGLNEELLAKGKTQKNFKSKAAADKIQAEADKLKQELFVSRLTRDLEKVAEQAAMYKVHATAQQRQKQELQQVLAETESVKGSLVMEYNQLFQQWNHSLMALKKQDAAFSEMHEALRNATDQSTTLSVEVDGYKKSIKVEKEKYKTLMEKLERSRLDNTVTENLIEEQLTKQAELQHQYSTCLQILQDTENTYNRLRKQSKALEDEVVNRRRQVEKESAVRLELEGKITDLMQQKLIHQKSTKQPNNSLGSVKRQKSSLLMELEVELKSLGQECSETGQRVEALKREQDALNQDINKNDKFLDANRAKINALLLNIKQHHALVDFNNKRIQEIRERTGREILNPVQIQVDALIEENTELTEINTEKRQLWERQQGVLVELAQQKKANTTIFLDLQAKYCVLNQRKIRVESHIEVENREKTELMRYVHTLRGDRLKLDSLNHKNTQLRHALEIENALKATDNQCRLKESETQRVQMLMKQETIQDEKETLKTFLAETDTQIKEWESKIQILRETRATVDNEREDIDEMKAAVHQKRVHLTQLNRQKVELLRESTAAFERRESVLSYRDVNIYSVNKLKQANTEKQCFAIMGLKRRIKNTRKDVAGSGKKITELQGSKESLSNSIEEQRQRINKLRVRNDALDAETIKLQDDKDRNLFLLVALQNRAKQLQMVCDGTYQVPNTTRAAVDVALHQHQEFVDAASTVLQQVCDEFPQYRAVLRKPLLLLEAEQELSKMEA